MTPFQAFAWAVVLATLGSLLLVVCHYARAVPIPRAWIAAGFILGGLVLLLAGQAVVLGLVLAGAIE